MNRRIGKVLLAAALLWISAAPVMAAESFDIPSPPSADTRQALMVRDDGFLIFSRIRLYALEKDGDLWREACPKMKAAIGRNGFAPPGEKREGDGRTPSGVFALSLAFGYDASADTRMPYRQALDDDLWVDDPAAPDYNRWVKKETTAAQSYEYMRRPDDLYKYGLVIEYNTDPVMPGRGSAIFLHLRDDAGSPTAGCVAVSEADMLKILRWLDPTARPVIYLNPDH